MIKLCYGLTLACLLLCSCADRGQPPTMYVISLYTPDGAQRVWLSYEQPTPSYGVLGFHNSDTGEWTTISGTYSVTPIKMDVTKPSAQPAEQNSKPLS